VFPSWKKGSFSEYVSSTVTDSPGGMFPACMVKISTRSCSTSEACFPDWSASWYSLRAFPRSFTFPLITRSPMVMVKSLTAAPPESGKVYTASRCSAYSFLYT